MRKFHIRGVPTALAAATVRTLLQAVSAGEAFSIVEASVSIQGSSNGDDPSVLCEFVRQTGAGTSVAAIIVPGDPGWPETRRVTGLSTFSSTEPATLQVGGIDQIFKPQFVHPKGGSYTWRFAIDEVIVGGTGNNTRLGLRATPSGTLTGTVTGVASFIVVAS